MLAAVLTKTGKADKAFQIKEVPEPTLSEGTVKVKVEAFGLNFADVMARQGLYQDCPPLPTILGYDVVGLVEEVAQGVDHVMVGDRVVALTRFGGYAQYVVSDARACAVIDANYDPVKATALSTQYCTAWFCLHEMVRLYLGDKVLIHAAAGGLGTAMVQLALHFQYTVFATAGSEEKVANLRKAGVHYPINYTTKDYEKEIKNIAQQDRPLDAVFNSVGGTLVPKDLRLLNAGGREVLCGAAKIMNTHIFGKAKELLGFGFYHPIQFMMKSRGIIGVNMLQVADNKPEVISRCLQNVVSLAQQGILDPYVGGYYPIDELGKAHELLETRKTTGKIAIHW